MTFGFLDALLVFTTRCLDWLHDFRTRNVERESVGAYADSLARAFSLLALLRWIPLFQLFFFVPYHLIRLQIFLQIPFSKLL